MIVNRTTRRWLLTVLGLMLALSLPPALAKGTAIPTTPLSLWRVSDHAGHVMYLAGSMHALTQADLPLPTAYTKAFYDSDRLVEELNLAHLDPSTVSQQAMQMGMLQNTTLGKVMGKTDWTRAKALAAKANIDLSYYAHFKPWLAAVGVADTLLIKLGYKPQLGPDMHFARLARKRKMASNGLETVAEQLSFFNDMKLSVQKRFLMQTLAQATTAKQDLAKLHAAWAHGDMATLEALQKENFKGFVNVRKRLIDERNARWLPHLKKCLASGQTCFVVVGVEHMVGPHGLLALLRAAGAKVTQMHTRPAHAGGA
ncbi:MAG: TraB/GumN family protein [Gammaproteobacteria bacterium]